MYLKANWEAEKEIKKARIVKNDCESGSMNPGLSMKQTILLSGSVILPLFAYIWSNSQAVYEHAGAVEGSLMGTFFQEPKFFLKFLLSHGASI